MPVSPVANARACGQLRAPPAIAERKAFPQKERSDSDMSLVAPVSVPVAANELYGKPEVGCWCWEGSVATGDTHTQDIPHEQTVH